MKLVRRLLYFMAAFILTLGLVLGLAYKTTGKGAGHFGSRASLFEVRDIPVSISETRDRHQEAMMMRHSPGAVSDLKTRLTNELTKYAHQKIWEINLGAMQAAILHDEWVKDVHISRIFPNELSVVVKEQVPILVLVTAKNGEAEKMLPVTDEGRLLSALSPELVPDVPLLRGDSFGVASAEGEAMRKKAIAFAESLPPTGTLSLKNVSEISWNAEEGFSLTLMNPKTTIILGDEQIDLKVLRVAQVFNYMTTNHLKGRVIDASFSKKVLVRLRKAP